MAVNQDTDIASAPSEFNINYVRILTTRSDDPIDITKMINYMEIYESIYSPFLTLKVNITDAISLTSILPLIGEEYLEVDIVGADGEIGLRAHGFYIYKMSDRANVSDRAVSYTLHAISGPAIVDMNLKISQAFTGQPSDIVENQLCKVGMSIGKQIYSHPTKNKVSYISNYWSPVQNIKYLCDRAVSSNTNSPSYVFFETKKSFVFCPLDILVSQDAVADYFYSINTHSNKLPLDKEQGIVHKMYVDDGFDYIDRIMTGAYGNRSLVVNTTNKRYNYNYYDFLDAFSKFARLNQKPMASEAAVRRINSVFRTRTQAGNSFDGMASESTGEWFSQRLTELASINSQTVFLDVAGRMNIYAGNVINLIVPLSHISTSDSAPKDFSETMDKTLSGRYLITSIKHFFDRERHTTHLQINKDSLFKTDNK